MRALGIILAGGNNNKMRELSNKRAVAAMPVAGSFRSIDFALSSMANSHIQKVAVLTQYNARSLNEHLRALRFSRRKMLTRIRRMSAAAAISALEQT